MARARTHPVVWLVVTATAIVAAGMIALADHAPSEAARNSAETYLPPDGSARVVEYADGATWIVESAHSTGVLFMLQQPGISGGHQLDAVSAKGDDVGQLRYWRNTWTDESGERGQLTEVFELDDDGVRQLTLTGGTNGFSYVPGLLVLPADVAPGSSWSSSGAALPQGLLDYESTATAAAGDDGCLVVDSETRYLDPAQDGAVLQVTTETNTWCAGLGLTEATFSTDGIPGSATSRALENRSVDVTSAPRDLDFGNYGTWSEKTLELVTTDPVFGESAYFTTTDSTSATTASGIAVFNTGVDVAAYRVDGARAERVWLARPGGKVLWLTTIGEVVIVGTTERTVVAYESTGLRAWSVELGDVLGAEPVADGLGGVLLQVLDGTLLRLDLVDGDVVWQTSLLDDADVAPTVGESSVYAVDRDGNLRSLGLATGEDEWSISVPENVSWLAANADRVFATDDFGGVMAWDATTGAPRWAASVAGVPHDLEITEDRVVVQSDEATVAWDFTGNRQWTVAAGDGLLTDGRFILLADAGVAVLADAEGNQLEKWDVPEIGLGTFRRVILGPDGFWVVGSDFTVEAVGP